ncbi:peptidase S8/S53 domain-containing protein [Dichotomocladium elegans]|nr:peptidase S8/S53 domain-containing protein [Dichotomocladium elegans]
MHSLFILLLGTALLQYTIADNLKRDYENRLYYTLYTPTPDPQAAALVAEQLHARFEGPVGELDRYYWISQARSRKRDDDNSNDLLLHFERLKAEARGRDKKRQFSALDQVQRVDPQVPKRRLVKRATIPKRQDEEPLPSPPDALDIHDPGFEQQWHLVNQEQRGHDINVTGVWSQGIIGTNVVVAILDDGLDMNSEDLKENFARSYDFNARTELPIPRLDDDNHGTRCAGEIAAVKNDVCGVGVAYGAKVAGIRILSEDITDADEAVALNYKYQENHVYSCSWGPPDLGEVAEAPQGIVLDAIKNGIKNGRNGAGTIFVFASGNGGANDDNCNYDGYTNSMYTITVGAIDRLGNHPYYAERCSAQLVVTYSSGSRGHIYTTDVGRNECSSRHGGTSAAAPLAAGIFALVLSVRPDLTWRDLQYLCVETAVPISLEDSDWDTLPSGRLYNHKFGYGKLDAFAIVEHAKTFESVGPQTYLQLSEEPIEKQDIPDLTDANNAIDKSRALTSTIAVTQEMVDGAGLGRLEHVTVTVNIEHGRRGDLETLLESPNGITSQLGSPRKFDTSTEGFVDWTFMTVKHWTENPVGNWTLRVVDGKNPQYTGKFVNWTITLWGELTPGFEGTPVNVPSKMKVQEENEETQKATHTNSSEFSSATSVQDLPSHESTTMPDDDLYPSTGRERVPVLGDEMSVSPLPGEGVSGVFDLEKDDHRPFFAYTAILLFLLTGIGAALVYMRRRRGISKQATQSTSTAAYISLQQLNDDYEFELLRRKPLERVSEESPSDLEEFASGSHPKLLLAKRQSPGATKSKSRASNES